MINIALCSYSYIFVFRYTLIFGTYDNTEYDKTHKDTNAQSILSIFYLTIDGDRLSDCRST